MRFAASDVLSLALFASALADSGKEQACNGGSCEATRSMNMLQKRTAVGAKLVIDEDTEQGLIDTKGLSSRTTMTTVAPSYAPWSWQDTWDFPRSPEDDARFLIHATFGPTSDDMAALQGKPYIDWITEQMALPVGSHRRFYRERTSPRLTIDEPMGVPRRPCEKFSRWTNYALRVSDIGKTIVKQADGRVLIDGRLRTEIDPAFVGNSLQASTVCTDERNGNPCTPSKWNCWSDWWRQKGYCQQSCYHIGHPYPGDVCNGWDALPAGENLTVCKVNEGLGEWTFIAPTCTDNVLYSTVGYALPNPGIFLNAMPEDSNLTFTSVTSDNLPAGAVVLQDGQAPGCSLETTPIVRSGSKLYVYESRLALLENTPESPSMAPGQAVCPKVARHPLNEKDCKVTSTCDGGFLACGSINEVSNRGEHNLYIHTEFDNKILDRVLDDNFEDVIVHDQKCNVWLEKAIHGDDQLRQRMAWALSQIIVAAEFGGDQDRSTEMWVNFYDIFVRHAFGNFKDILREVTYSPVMGDYLTYRKNNAFDKYGKYPDENYAREIMQLFTIGLWKLHEDGSRVWDEYGDDASTYDNEHITNIARVFTGLVEQGLRPNIEPFRSNHNMLDPMIMDTSRKDVYPKIDLAGNHLGDGLPLCHDLPEGSFLKQGAAYEFIGCSYAGVDVMELDATSGLKAALDGWDSTKCPGGFSDATRVLAADVTCTGHECTVGVPEVVKVGTGYYRYLPPTCVHLFFFQGKITRMTGSRWTSSYWTRCQNPRARVAGSWCCKGCKNTPSSSWDGLTCEEKKATFSESSWATKCNSSTWWVNSKRCELLCWQDGMAYVGSNCSDGAYTEEWKCGFPLEQVTYAHAAASCSAAGLGVCGEDRDERPVDEALGSFCRFADGEQYVWTKEDCTSPVRVYPDGTVASLLDDDTKNNMFRVYWANGQQPQLGACAAHGCSETPEGDSCECGMTLSNHAVLATKPTAAPEVEAALPELKIGAFSHEALGTPSSCGTECSVFWNDAAPEKSVISFRGRFYKNVVHVVKVGDGQTSFRNPPAFTLAARPDERQAYAEIEAFLDHLFEHPNTPVYISQRLIQRFVTSNPSPGYIRNVSKAFQTGSYFGKTFSGKRGDLAATLAAILLDPEARSTTEAQTTGALREPLIKLVHFMRSMQYQDIVYPQKRLLSMKNLHERFGQYPYNSPTVFNYYSFEFQPPSFPAGLYAPEFQIFTPPMVVGFFNGMMEILRRGVSSCGEGFGQNAPPCDQGRLAWAPTTAETAAAVHEMDLLLTGGRLNASRAIVEAAYDSGATAEEKVNAAQKAVLMSPEFHTLGMSHDVGSKVLPSPATPPVPQDYKALVLLFMGGGADTFNMVVPSNVNCNLYDQYVAVRTDVALPPGELLEFDVAGQVCSKFSLHGKLPFLHSLYSTQGKAAIVANVGSIPEPTSKDDFQNHRVQRCAGLYSHSDQQTAAMTMECQTQGASPRGFGGRMADVLTKAGMTASSFSLKGMTTFAEGFNTTVDILDGKDGALTFKWHTELKSTIDSLVSKEHSNIYCEEYSKQLKHALDSTERLAGLMEAPDVEAIGGFPATAMGGQLHQVARLIKTRHERRSARDIFFVEIGGFDTHSDARGILSDKFVEINDALQAFVGELQTQGTFNDVTLVSASDFGRTLTSNGAGTDHAWAGNHFILGGSVNGGKMYNSFPVALTPGSPQDLGKGRLVPQYPWESVFLPVAEWMGVRPEDVPYVFPNAGRFNSSYLISKSALFA